MNTTLPALPECPPFVAAVLQRLPALPASAALALGLNAILAPKLPADVAPMLLKRKLRIHIRDAGVKLDFTWNGRRFVPLPTQSQCDLTVSASGPDFLRLAQRQEDPDTLFFSRRLGMEGDTELGLVVKNTLDAMEGPIVDLSRFLPRKPAAPPARHGRGPWS